jgi:ribosomal protein S18 acetylase RimI-like enzyme
MPARENIRVIEVTGDRVDEAADVLTEAFTGYPMMGFFFPPGTAQVRRRIRALFEIGCIVRVKTGEPLLGVELDGHLVGAAGATTPDKPEDPPEMEAIYEEAFAVIGPETGDRFEQYSRAKEAHQPAEAHHYLAMVGVLGSARGLGIGRALIQRVHALADAHPRSVGVALDTQDPSNVGLYEKLGYRVTARDELGGVPMWYMLRPRGA